MKKNKKQNLKEVAYLREINKERIKINEKLNNTLTDLVRKGENLENYEIWANKKCDIFIQPVFIIKKYAKDLENEGFDKDTAYVIVKIDSEAVETAKEISGTVTINISRESSRHLQKMLGIQTITRKRFIKLLMGCGIQRNDAQKIAKIVHSIGTVNYSPTAVQAVYEYILNEMEKSANEMS